MANKKKKQEEVQPTSGSYVSVDTFITTAKVLYKMSNLQVAGFKAYMTGRQYLRSDMDFVPYLEKYLGKGDK
jgi:hypothetical protein